MADDSPTRARSSASNPSKSQTVRGKQANNAPSRSKVVTRPRTLSLPFPSGEPLIRHSLGERRAPLADRLASRTPISGRHVWPVRCASFGRVAKLLGRTKRRTPLVPVHPPPPNIAIGTARSRAFSYPEAHHPTRVLPQGGPQSHTRREEF